MGLLLVIILVLVLLGLSALCSGLNIALMSLDLGDLSRKAKLGNQAAIKVLPLRRNTHLTLASILIANVAVISATSLVMSKWLNGWLAGIISTLLIVIFGEILPQAYFGRHALKLTGRFEPLLKGMVAVTYPLSKPMQLLLIKLMGKETKHLQSRGELGILIAEHANDQNGSELDDDEIEIMQGALKLSEKRVSGILTPIKHVYWLTPQTKIDAQKIDEIKAAGFSRIPIFDEGLTKSYGLLLMKELVDRDFDDEPQAVEELPLYSCQLIGSRTALDTLFRRFISGGTHLLPVERDDKIIGIVTIEDLLEEIVGHEIEDETDRAKALRKNNLEKAKTS